MLHLIHPISYCLRRSGNYRRLWGLGERKSTIRASGDLPNRICRRFSLCPRFNLRPTGICIAHSGRCGILLLSERVNLINKPPEKTLFEGTREIDSGTEFIVFLIGKWFALSRKVWLRVNSSALITPRLGILSLPPAGLDFIYTRRYFDFVSCVKVDNVSMQNLKEMHNGF